MVETGAVSPIERLTLCIVLFWLNRNDASREGCALVEYVDSESYHARRNFPLSPSRATWTIGRAACEAATSSINGGHE